MRDAIHVQQFHIASENLDLDEIVHQSAVKELATLKALDTTGPRTGAGKCSASKAADGVKVCKLAQEICRQVDAHTHAHARSHI